MRPAFLDKRVNKSKTSINDACTQINNDSFLVEILNK